MILLCINIRNGTVVLFKDDDEAYSYLSIIRYALKFINNEFVFFFVFFSAALFLCTPYQYNNQLHILQIQPALPIILLQLDIASLVTIYYGILLDMGVTNDILLLCTPYIELQYHHNIILYTYVHFKLQPRSCKASHAASFYIVQALTLCHRMHNNYYNNIINIAYKVKCKDCSA